MGRNLIFQPTGGGGGVTNWTAYTPTVTGCGTLVLNETYWRSVGSDTTEVMGTFIIGTQAAAALTITLPNSETINANFLDATRIFVFGSVVFANAGLEEPNITTGLEAFVVNNTTTNSTVLVAWRVQSQAFVQENVNVYLGTNALVSFKFSYVHT